MGFMTVIGNCVGCHRVFSFSPSRVPSVVLPSTGKREPICESCVRAANPLRIAKGLPPIHILPGAYEGDEA